MNKFDFVKNEISPKTLFLKYFGYPDREKGDTWLYYSMLRTKERTPSLAVNNKKGITDFGTSKHYDIISFIAEYYNCSQSMACDDILEKFGYSINDTKSKKSLSIIHKQVEEQILVQKAIDKWYEETYIFLCNVFLEYRNLAFNLPFDCKSLPFIYKKLLYYESLVDLFFNADTEMKIELYKNRERFDFNERKREVF